MVWALLDKLMVMWAWYEATILTHTFESGTDFGWLACDSNRVSHFPADRVCTAVSLASWALLGVNLKITYFS